MIQGMAMATTTMAPTAIDDSWSVSNKELGKSSSTCNKREFPMSFNISRAAAEIQIGQPCEETESPRWLLTKPEQTANRKKNSRLKIWPDARRMYLAEVCAEAI